MLLSRDDGCKPRGWIETGSADYLLERNKSALKWALSSQRRWLSSVLWHRRIDLFRPSQNAAGEVRNIRESSLLEGQRGLLAAYASFAVDDDFAVLFVCQLGGAALNVTDRNQRRTEIRDLMLMRLAGVEDEDVFLRIQLPFQLLHGDLRNAVDHRAMGCFDMAWLQPLNEPVSCRSGSSFKVITL